LFVLSQELTIISSNSKIGGMFMIILGMDPGTAVTGYGLIKSSNNKLEALDWGCILTSACETFPARLNKIYSQTTELIKSYQPNCLVVEEIYFSKNTRSALAVGHARGVVLLAAAQAGVSIHEYAPLQVKQAVVGYGRAAKEQVQYMVQLLLELKDLPRPDAADALAIGLCHHQSAKWYLACNKTGETR
jgi:crossover junction endodeoxyribonuclease RuvC